MFLYGHQCHTEHGAVRAALGKDGDWKGRHVLTVGNAKDKRIFASYKPTMSFDELTGIPTFSITVQPNQREESLKQILIICDYRKSVSISP